MIFYDGFNDSRLPPCPMAWRDVSFDERNRRTEFRVFNHWANDNSLLLRRRRPSLLIRQSGLGQLAKRILLWLAPGPFRRNSKGSW